MRSCRPSARAAWAIKILSDESAADADRRERFERETKAISALDHPNICALYDVGEHEDGRWLAYVSNESGRPEVYVQPYPITGSKEIVSSNGLSDLRNVNR